MPNINAGQQTGINIPAGQVLTLTGSSNVTGMLRIFSPDRASRSQTNVIPGASSYGPYAADANGELQCWIGDVTYEVAAQAVQSPAAGLRPGVDADYATAVVGAAASAQRSALRFCIPGRDASTAFSDISGNAATCTVDAGNTGAFATPDYMATIVATNGGLTVAGAKCSLNFATDSFILAFVMKMAAPGANQNLLALHANTVSSGNTGIYLSHRTSGALKIVPTVGATITNAQADSTLVFSDGTPKDRHCTVTYDAPTGVFSIYRDGVLSDSFTGTPMAGSNAFPNAVQSNAYRIGGIASGASMSSIVTLTYGHQLYGWTGSLPAKIGQVASILANNPRNPLPLGALNV